MADGRLIFYRLWAWQDALRSYKIEVDGTEVAVLKPRSSVPVTLPEGVRTCRARIAWTGSERTDIQVLANQEMRVLVAPGRGLAVTKALGTSGYLVLLPQPTKGL